jgi:hypothetical protein
MARTGDREDACCASRRDESRRSRNPGQYLGGRSETLTAALFGSSPVDAPLTREFRMFAVFAEKQLNSQRDAATEGGDMTGSVADLQLQV